MTNSKGDPEPGKDDLSSRKRLPHKFCAYCGFKNEASVENCEQCGKDISWMRIPEPSAKIDVPPEKPRSEPKREPVFTGKAIVVIIVVFLLLAGLITAIILIGISKNSESGSRLEMSTDLVSVLYQRPVIDTYRGLPHADFYLHPLQ